MAEHIAEVGRLPLLDLLAADGPPPPAESASLARVSALLGRITLAAPDPVPPGPLLLVDDVLRSGWTVTVAASRLVEGGAEVVLPLVGHRRP